MPKKPIETVQERPAEAPWTPPAGAVTYIGPDALGVQHMTTFLSGLPDKLLRAAREECKALRGLIVPVAAISAKTIAAKTPGTAENTLYAKAEAFARGEE